MVHEPEKLEILDDMESAADQDEEAYATWQSLAVS